MYSLAYSIFYSHSTRAVPRAAALDFRRLEAALREELALQGPRSARDLLLALGISQPSFSRLVRRLGAELVTVGVGRNTRYALRKRAGSLRGAFPIHEVNETGRLERLGTLSLIEPQGFVVLGADPDLPSATYDDLPWFLGDLRPAGFLGRQIPLLHSELQAPGDIQLWSGEHCLEYLVRHGHDTVGAFVLGDPDDYLQTRASSLRVVAATERSIQYPRLAEDALAGGPPGSSAAGEQPKFLAWRGAEPSAVLVKFSPPGTNDVAQRVRDLLVVEHIAHDVLGSCGFPRTRSELLPGGGRTFLEVERFDRVGLHGRRGVLSLRAFDVEFVGTTGRWSTIAETLVELGRINQAHLERIRWLELFGELIANSDMHAGNLSFYSRGTRILDLAPVYDMTPMLYAPDRNQIVVRPFAPKPPRAEQIEVWDEASSAAEELWRRVAQDSRVSPAFRALADANAIVVQT